jgi:hypothetical protein
LVQDYSIATVCQVLDYPRRQVYYKPQPPLDETDVALRSSRLQGNIHRMGIAASLRCCSEQGNRDRDRQLAETPFPPNLHHSLRFTSERTNLKPQNPKQYRLSPQFGYPYHCLNLQF